MNEDKKYPVVLRMAGMFPKDLGRYEGHRTRNGGDLGHVDKTRSKLNRRLIGGEDWAHEVQAEIAEMAQENFAAELEKLKKRRRKTEALKRIAEGPRDPWRATRHGPLREVILTANKKWFDSVDDGSLDDLCQDSPEDRFEVLALSWLKEHFGEDLVHARADLDEDAYHIHAVIVPRSVTTDGRRMLQPSKYEMIRDYEKAQDSVGEWFAGIGLVRGERRAKAIREAIDHNKTLRDDQDRRDVPEKRPHVSPRDWRREQERTLAEKEDKLTAREKKAKAREQDAGAVLDVANAVARGETDILDEDSQQTANPRAKMARQLFGKAVAALGRKARREAREDLHREYELIRKTNEAIAEVINLLPEQARRAIKEARTSLGKSIAHLRVGIDRLGGQKRDDDPRG